MNPFRRTLLHVLAAASLGVLGWDALRPLTNVPDSSRDNPPARPSLPPPDAEAGESPQLTHLTADRVLLPGQRLTVRGRIRGLNSARPTTLSVEGPDGSMATTELRGDAPGDATFSIQHPTAAVVPGAFVWKLRIQPSEETVVLGVHVAKSDRPRVLLLMDHPDVEGARLHRWLAEEGSPVTTRTRVSADRHRLTSSAGNAVDLVRLDTNALAAFDVVVAHAVAIDNLSPDEQRDLDLVVRREGVGLLILGSSPSSARDPDEVPPPNPSANDPSDGGPPPTGSKPSGSPLTSNWFRRTNLASELKSDPRETRIELFDGTLIESPATVLDAELVVPLNGRALARDPQGRPLVAQASLGRGRWAFSIVLDAWRWRQQGRRDDYAHFWSTLLSTIARSEPAASASWSLSDASNPFFVDHPITLAWSGAPSTQPPSAEIQAHNAQDEAAIPLNLNPVPSEPSVGRAMFWPVHPGWHTVRALPSGPTLDFYVHPSHALSGVRAQQKTDAALRASKTETAPGTSSSIPSLPTGSHMWIRYSAFFLFVLTTALLWLAGPDSRSPRFPGQR